jgi:N-acetylneuraminic acid mutarotase
MKIQHAFLLCILLLLNYGCPEKTIEDDCSTPIPETDAPERVLINEPVKIKEISSAAYDSYSWQFSTNDREELSGIENEEMEVKFTAPGWVTIYLIVTDSCGENSVEEELFVADYGVEMTEVANKLPTGRGWFTANAIDNKFYLVGGTNQDSKDIDVFDPETETWQILEGKLKQSRCAHSSAVAGNQIYIFGGTKDLWDTDPVPGLSTIEVYDTESGVSEYKSQLYEPKIGAAACYLEGKIYIFGGNTQLPLIKNGYSDRVFVWDLGEDKWMELPSMSFKRAFATTHVIDGKIWVVGGANWDPNKGDHFGVKEIEIFDPATNSWDMGPEIPEGAAVWNHASLVNENRLYIFGGYISSAVKSNNIQLINITTWESESFIHLPMKLAGLAACAIGDNFYLFGDASGVTDMFTTRYISVFKGQFVSY